MIWRRLAYAKTDPRNRHGAWHAQKDVGVWACGSKEDPTKQLQSLEVDGRPPGATCIECLKALGFPVDVERTRRSGFSRLPKAKRR